MNTIKIAGQNEKRNLKWLRIHRQRQETPEIKDGKVAPHVLTKPAVKAVKAVEVAKAVEVIRNDRLTKEL